MTCGLLDCLVVPAKDVRVNASLILFAQITKFAAVVDGDRREIAAVVVICQ
jgi:hypothetical protein